METPDMYRALAAIWWAGIWNGPSTQEEAEAIGRLQQLGFPREVCLQAWIACEKNEALAANLLF